MQDIQLYEQVLGLREPWSVEQVRLEKEQQQIVIRVQCTEQVWGCPECGQRAHVHDYQTRQWRHLDTCQFQTILEANLPRVKCPEHGTVTVRVPWAEPHGRFTSLFERLAIDLLQECSISAAQRILRISWDQADGIKQRAVKRGLKRRSAQPMPRLCVDEKCWAGNYQFATIVAEVPDGQPAYVHTVEEGKDKESLDRFWATLNSEQLEAIEAVGMDMSPAFLSSTQEHLPQADDKITHDPFHLSRHMNQALNQVRRSEHQSLKKEGQDDLHGTRYFWLYGMENLPKRYQEQWERLSTSNLKTARAWRIKEGFRWFWWQSNVEQAKQHFQEWYSWAIRSRLEPIKKVAKMLKRHLTRILNYFRTGLTNGPIEGLNSRIQGLIKKAYGYRSFERFRNDIFFHLGNLNLYPSNCESHVNS